MLHSHYYLPELARIKSYLQSTSTEKYLEKHNKKLRTETFQERSLEHIAQQLMLAQNLTLQLRIQSPPNHNVYSCKCKNSSLNPPCALHYWACLTHASWA